MNTTDTLSLRERAKAAHRETADSQTKFAREQAEQNRVRRLKAFTQLLRNVLREDPPNITGEVYEVDGLRFHYVGEAAPYGTYLECVSLETGECPKCHEIILERVDYLDQVGAYLQKMEAGEIPGLWDHNRCCPGRGVEIVTTPPKTMPSSIEQLADTLVDFLQDRGFTRNE
jgi:hypothetical protein